MGYQRNKYDWCVMNKIDNDKQCTILFHVDDLNMLQVDSNIFSSVLADVEAKYGKFVKITITRGKINKYFRMTIDYSFTGKVILYMFD